MQYRILFDVGTGAAGAGSVTGSASQLAGMSHYIADSQKLSPVSGRVLRHSHASHERFSVDNTATPCGVNSRRPPDDPHCSRAVIVSPRFSRRWPPYRPVAPSGRSARMLFISTVDAAEVVSRSTVREHGCAAIPTYAFIYLLKAHAEIWFGMRA